METAFVPSHHALLFKNAWILGDTDIENVRRILEQQVDEIVSAVDAAVRQSLSAALGGNAALAVLDGAVTHVIPSVRRRVMDNVIGAAGAGSFGMCGGMAFVGLDYYQERTRFPPLVRPPLRADPDGAFRELVWARLIDSIELNGVTFVEWTVAYHIVPVVAVAVVQVINAAAAAAMPRGKGTGDIPVIGDAVEDVVDFVIDNVGGVVEKIGEVTSVVGKSLSDFVDLVPLGVGPALFPGLTIAGAVLATGGFVIEVLGQAVTVDAGGEKEIARRTLENWVSVKAALDSGMPVALGLLTDGIVFTDHHQVVVRGYDQSADGSIHLKLWDSNHGNVERPLKFRPGVGGIECEYQVSGRRVLGFFRLAYRSRTELPTDTPCPGGAVSRRTSRLDVFWIGQDGAIGSTAWEGGVNGNAWADGFPVTRPGAARGDSPVVAVARTRNRLDVYWVGDDGAIGSTAWEGGVDGNRWATGFPVTKPGAARAGSPLAVVSRTPNRIDVFWIGHDGAVGSTAWEGGVNGNAWADGFPVTRPGAARGDSPVVAVARTRNRLDVYWIGEDGAIGSTAWEGGVDGNRWATGFPVTKPGAARAGSPLAVVSRTPNRIDVFWIGHDGAVGSTAWEGGVNGNAWADGFPVTRPGAA